MTTASKITLIRVALIPVFLITMYLSQGQAGVYLWISLAIFVIASLTDFVDGQIARKCNQVSDFGKFLDPLADKLLVLSAMCMYCEWQIFPAWALMIVLSREFAVSGLRMIASGKGNVIAAGWSGKVKTFATMVGLCFMMGGPGLGASAALLNILNWTVIIVIVVTTLYSGVEYFVKNWSCLWD